MATTPQRAFPCRDCAGEGRAMELTSGHGGNDPWSTYRDAGECRRCGGSGNEPCADCGDAPATDSYVSRGKARLVCRACFDEEAELLEAAERGFAAAAE